MQKAELLIKRPKVFALQSHKRGPVYYDYQNVQNLIWSQGSDYICQRKIGRGKYSQVFDAICTLNSQPCVVKMLKPIKFKKINREIKILMALRGKNNTIKLIDIVKQGETHCLVFEQVNSIQYKKLLEIIKPQQCKYYLYQILKGLHYCHSIGIMHRDIKPQNVMIDHENKKVRIIDWGLAEFYLPEKDYNVRVSSRYFKGPELLVSYEYYHYSLDIWSLGVMMAGMVILHLSKIFNRQPFFKGADNYDQLQQITKVLGTDELYAYLNKYNIPLEIGLQRVLGQHRAVKLTSFVNENNKHLATPDALDLLGKMMQYDHDTRPTAQQCMKHPFFDEIRQQQKQI